MTSKLVCAPMGDPGVLFIDGADTVTALDEDREQVTGPTVLDDQREPVVISGDHAVMGGMDVTTSAGRTSVACAAPRSEGVLVLPGAADTDLVLVNPDASEAVVDLNLYGTDGEILALGARGIAVGPHSSRTVALSVLVDGEEPVGVHYRASSGRVAVAARTDGVAGLEATTASDLAREYWLAGVPQDATVATVMVMNPGDERATVQMTAFGAATGYRPEGGADVSVPAQSVVAVELADALAGEASGLRVTSDVDVAVTLSTGEKRDFASAASVQTSEELGAIAAAGGELQVSNPGAAEATVEVVVDVVEGEATEMRLTIPAGGTATAALPATAPRGLVVDVTSSTPVFGAIVYATDGAAVVPLATTSTPPPASVDAEIVPTLR